MTVAEAAPAGGPALRVVSGGVVPKLGPDGRQLRACGAARVSEGKQAEGHSPQTQRLAIIARARADGYAISDEDIYEDHERGHVLTRKGYVAILGAVREGKYSAVYVFMLDRWGRDSIERQQRGKEFDKLGVPLISVVEGVDEPGLVRVIRAELAEEESRKNAQRVTPNRESAARKGTHMGRTPIGYQREYPAWDGHGKRPCGVLVPHEPAPGDEPGKCRCGRVLSHAGAGDITGLFVRYATSQWSTREVAMDLNGRGITGAEGEPWTTQTVCDVLRNVTYAGDVGYNRRARGHYLAAAPGSAFVAEGHHTPLVDRETYDAVQRRLAEARTYQAVARRTPHAHLLSGLVRCEVCKGLMVPNVAAQGSGRRGQVLCAGRHKGRGCAGRGFRLDLAQAALLDQVRRLQGAPWTLEQETLLAGEDGAAAAALDRELQQARDKLTRANRRFMVEIEEPTAEDRAAFEAVRCEMGARIRDLEQQQAQLKHDAQALPRLRKLHERLTKTEIGDVIDGLQAHGDEVGLRDLVTGLVQSATLVERYPQTRSTWLRLHVTWQPDVQKLLDHGYLTLAPERQRPLPEPIDPTV
jgi:DNA invertase Pin-like site-specific DNA recombinase